LKAISQGKTVNRKKGEAAALQKRSPVYPDLWNTDQINLGN